MRYLAIDYGNKRTGLAICDAGETITSPLAVIRGQSMLLRKIAEAVETNSVEAIVIGLPLNMDGSEGQQSRIVRRFGESLGRHTAVPIYFQDERLSSFGAKEKLASAELKASQAIQRLDAVAAAEILEAFLEQRRENKQHPSGGGSDQKAC
jgi:putative Holliday junction resolvase